MNSVSHTNGVPDRHAPGIGPTVFLAILMVVGCLMVGLLTFIAATGQNDVAATKERALINSALRSELSDLGRTATDYSWWDDALENLITRFDPEWASANIGAYLFRTFGIAETLVFDAGNRLLFRVKDGEIVAPELDQRSIDNLRPLLAEARGSPFDPVRAAFGPAWLNGGAHLVAASALSPQKASGASADASDRGVLVMAKRVDEALLARFAERFLVDGLKVATRPAAKGEERVPLFSRGGELVAVLTWIPSNPGADLIAWVLPAVLAGGLVTVLLCRRVLIMWRDERRRADHARSEFDAVSGGVSDAIVIVDERGNSVAMNDSAARLLRPKDCARDGTPLWRMLRDGERAVTVETLDALAESGAGLDLVATAERFPEGGGGRPVEVRVSRIVKGGDCGPEREWVIVARDIADRKRLEENLRAAKEQAELASRSKSRFLATMTHELRTPLNAIIGFSELIRAQAMGPIRPDGYRAFIDDIHAGGRQLLSIVNDILDIATVDAGDTRLSDDVVTPDEAIDACVRLFRDGATARGVSIVATVGDGRVPLRVDERLFKRMVGNLLSNAIQFTPSAGTVSVSTRLVEDGGMAIAVRDDGKGIPADQLDRVFDAFHQVEDGSDRSHSGAGLGLTLTRAMIERHHGKVTLESVEGKGTAVTLWFPKDRVLPDPARIAVGLKAAVSKIVGDAAE